MQKLLPPSLKNLELSQLNPQFAGIAKHLGKSHNNRRQAEHSNRAIGNHVSFLKKESDSAEKKILKKQRELQKLMNTIARKQAQNQHKEALRQAREEALAQQRQLNIRRRNQHQERARNAFLSLYDEHHDNVTYMRNTFKRQEQMRKSFQKDTIEYKQEKVLKRSLDREQGRKKINSFHKERVDLYTSRYKSRIEEEQKEAAKLNKQSQIFNEQQKELKGKLQHSNSRIEALDEEIIKATYQFKALQVNKSFNWSSLSKDHPTVEDTKEDSARQPDSKLDKLIQKQLEINDE